MPARRNPSRRERLRAETYAAIKATARRLMAEQGTAGLSIRAIAREMGMTAPALYHYYDSLDDLITALIVEAFHALAETLEQARDSQPASEHGGRMMAVGHAYRAWALAHPTPYYLIFGTPIPGYEAPVEVTLPAARRAFAVLVEMMAAALADGALAPPESYLTLPASIATYLADQVAEPGVPLAAYFLAAEAWSQVYAAVTLELTGQWPPIFGDMDALFKHKLTHFTRYLGLEPPD